MGKFTTIIPREYPKIDYSNVIRDIHNQLFQGRKVRILYDSSKISREDARKGLLSIIPTEDLYQVLFMDKQDFENQKVKNPDMNWCYQISVEGVLSYLPNTFRQSI